MTSNTYTIITSPTSSTSLIHDVITHPLVVNRDSRGTLTEGLKVTWKDIFDPQKMPFTQMYFSTTLSGVARDIDRWHYHPGGQQDRFGVIAGDIVVAIYDSRPDSPTQHTLNLFLMGSSQGDTGQYLLVIPPRTYHGYLVVSATPATMFNFPTRLYDPQEEQRIPFSTAPAILGEPFSWKKVATSYRNLSTP